MRSLTECRIPFRSPAGELLAHVTLTPAKDAEGSETAPLVETDEADAREFGETPVQLRETERYEYDVCPVNGADLRLRCSVASRRRSLGNQGQPDAGLIETRSFCGTLLLELVEGEVDNDKPAVASAALDVRSLKLAYRSEYRGMLRRLADEMAGLVADARSSAKTQFRSSFEDRTDSGWLQIQLELLREMLDSTDFAAALQRILAFPHERLSATNEMATADRPIRWNSLAVRELLARSPRRLVPSGHPLRTYGVETVAERVLLPRKWRDLDTPENRFVKFALLEFLAFLTHAQNVFEACAGWGVSAALSRRLSANVEDWLGRGFFRGIGDMQFAPFGSPVLQRKAGYREVLRGWQRFRTSAELSWQGGEDLFRAGLRDVASLYEYWLFFELLGWFCRKCRGGNRPAVEELVDGLDDGSPNLRLKKKMELGPFTGIFLGTNRRLNARFAYNRRFKVTKERHQVGSWTRQLHPDYTLSFWPDGFSEAEAEQNELLVHVHFDAKYRVEDLETLFGADAGDDADEDSLGNYKRQDLLKMHAYRDAIKRSQGAYVIYPGQAKTTFQGYHEILPGLGAFGVVPDEHGQAQGMEPLENFLNEVLAHLGNRTTAQERLSYHVNESYSKQEAPVHYGLLSLSETDIFGSGFRALPPAEHLVLVAQYHREAQRLLAEAEDGYLYVRLVNRKGSPYVHPNFAHARHVALMKEDGTAAAGLLLLRVPGFQVFSRDQLRLELERRAGELGVAAWGASAGTGDGGFLYALFRTRQDDTYAAQNWDGGALFRAIEAFENDARNYPGTDAEPVSRYPRMLPLHELLKARIS